MQVTAYGRQTVPDRDMVRSCDTLQNFGGSNHITGMAEPKLVKLCTRVRYITSSNKMPASAELLVHFLVLSACMFLNMLSYCNSLSRSLEVF